MRPVRLWIKYLHVVLTHKLRSKTRIIHETDYYCTPRGRIIGKFWEKWKLCCAKKSNVLDELKQAEKLRSRKMKKVGWKMKVESWRLKAGRCWQKILKKKCCKTGCQKTDFWKTFERIEGVFSNFFINQRYSSLAQLIATFKTFHLVHNLKATKEMMMSNEVCY